MSSSVCHHHHHYDHHVLLPSSSLIDIDICLSSSRIICCLSSLPIFHDHVAPWQHPFITINHQHQFSPSWSFNRGNVNPEISERNPHPFRSMGRLYIDLPFMVDFYGIIHVGKYAILCHLMGHETSNTSEITMKLQKFRFAPKTSGVPLAWLWVPRRVSLCSDQGWTCLGEEEMEESTLRGVFLCWGHAKMKSIYYSLRLTVS